MDNPTFNIVINCYILRLSLVNILNDAKMVLSTGYYINNNT